MWHETSNLAAAWVEYASNFEIVDYSYPSLCAGIEIKQPHFSFDKFESQTNSSRFSIRVPMNKRPLNIDAHCNSALMRANIDPDEIKKDKKKYSAILSNISQSLQDSLDDIPSIYESLSRLEELYKSGKYLIKYQSTSLRSRFLTPLIHMASSFHPYVRWCARNEPDLDNDMCAFQFLQQYDVDAADRLSGSARKHNTMLYMDYFHPTISYMPTYLLHAIGFFVLVLALCLPGSEQMPSSHETFKAIVVAVNFTLHLASMYRKNYQYGIDYSAYINQAGCVVSGETCYPRISSVQGPCFYPAGHLYFFVPAYLVHTYTEHAESIVKIVFAMFHSANIYLASSIAFRYFKNEPRRAQFVVLLLLANEYDRQFHQLMYNDQIMACCLLATIYFVAESMPTAAMIMFNLGLSIKIGVFLLLPSLLGQLQYRYGVGMLLKFAFSVYAI